MAQWLSGSVAQWLNWIEQPPPKGQVAGSNPAWVTNFIYLYQYFRQYLTIAIVPKMVKITIVKTYTKIGVNSIIFLISCHKFSVWLEVRI